jgi:4-hydroxyacetophenone monooxygenase
VPGYVVRIITDDDATIARHLEDLSVPTLMLAMVHLTGDPSWIRGDLRPLGSYINEVQGFMSPADQAAVRARALAAIIEFRDGPQVLPPPPGPELVREMMGFLVAGEVTDEYVPLLLEELELDGVDRRQVPFPPEATADARAAFPVVIVGAGMSGLLAGIRLGQAGVPYTIIEKNPRAGGTWHENRYPGCRVDVGNHFYCYSFEPDDHWTEFFARQPELQAYFERTAERHGVVDHIRFDTEVVGARWDEATARWSVTIRPAGSGDQGVQEVLDAAALVSAVGQLNRPKLPDIAGRDTFAGVAMHSAQWVDGTDLAGKRVAVVGTGASAFQIVPAIAAETEHLTVFQRSAPWMFPNPHYHDAVGDGVPWAIRNLPSYGRWYRFLLFWPACDGGLEAMRIDPDYPHPERAISEVNDAAREVFTAWMAEQVGDDAELLAKVVPDYVCLGKRTLQDNGSWLAALTRPDVDLVTDAIAEVVPEGIVDATGRLHEVDVIIWATGFQANRYLWPMEIVGRDGRVLAEQWGEEPTALLGVTVPGFPNLFCLYGPGTNSASGGSIIFLAECQVRYLMGCVARLVAAGPGAALEVTQDAHDAYNERLQAELATMVWSHPSIRHSWFRNAAGKIFVLTPWRMVDYWSWTREPDPAHYTLTRRGEHIPHGVY